MSFLTSANTTLAVRDNGTEFSRGFSFVTFDHDEMAGKAIKDMDRKEIKSVCPPHGRLSIEFAEKGQAGEQSEGEKKERPGTRNVGEVLFTMLLLLLLLLLLLQLLRQQQQLQLQILPLLPSLVGCVLLCGACTCFLRIYIRIIRS